MKNLLFKNLLWILLLMPSLFVACNDKEDTEITEEYDGSIDVDELDELQQNLVRTDSLGNFECRVLGVCLDKADTTIVSVGVESFEEAKLKFQNLFSTSTTISADGTIASFTKQTGSVVLEEKDGTDGVIGVIDFSNIGLKHISKLNFILSSAWPENAKSKGYHKGGVWYQYHGWTGSVDYSAPHPYPDWDEWHWFLCIKEADGKGNPAVLLAFTDTQYNIPWRNSDSYSGNIPTESKAKQIREILLKDWNTYKKKFNEKMGKTVLETYGEYWMKKGKEFGVENWRYTMNLYTGETDWWRTFNHFEYRTTMFYMESLAVSQ